MKVRTWWIVELANGRTMLHSSRTSARKGMKYLRENGLKPRAFQVVEKKSARVRK